MNGAFTIVGSKLYIFTLRNHLFSIHQGERRCDDIGMHEDYIGIEFVEILPYGFGDKIRPKVTGDKSAALNNCLFFEINLFLG